MDPEHRKRKLVALLSADVKGYSRLMSLDEEGTVRTLAAYKEAMGELIRQFDGRVVDSVGDNLLAEFGSVVDAVECAVEIQKDITDRNEDIPKERRMEFRIGVNLGDVVAEGEKVFGDGVNIVARMERLAEPGGICISGTAYDQVKHRLPYGFRGLGTQTVKNIAEPVRVYQVFRESRGGAASRRGSRRKGPSFALAAAGLVLALAGAVAVWKIALSPSPPKMEAASREKMAFPLPERPSIAVLPFLNLSGDPQQETLVDSLTNDLITDLSKISSLFVIARNSTFTYKGRPVKVKQVAEELGVRYILEGSVRRVGDEIRINAQLIDALTGHHLWADRYDGTFGNIFDLQDRITRKIITALAVKLSAEEMAVIAERETGNIEAYNERLRGTEHITRLTPDDVVAAIQAFKKATDLDPNYGRAYASLAYSYYMATHIGGLHKGLEASGVSWREARLLAGKYLKLAMKNPTPHARIVNTLFYLFRRQHEEAFSEIERALLLGPNIHLCNEEMGRVLLFSGRPKEAAEYFNRTIRINPRLVYGYSVQHGLAQFHLGNVEEAATLVENARRLNPHTWGLAIHLAAYYGLLGRLTEARAEMDHYERGAGAAPYLPILMYHYPFNDRSAADRFAEGLIRAGVKAPPWRYYPVFRENRLTGEEIRRLRFGSKVTGVGWDGKRWWAEGRKSGDFEWRGPDPIPADKGKMRIEGDMICLEYQKLNRGIEYCATVFKNPKGTYEGKDEYVACTDLGFSAFSPVR
jgi:TolB-like protein/class 3 adenylate cyclase